MELFRKRKENHNHSIILIIISSKILFKSTKPSKLKCRSSQACEDPVTFPPVVFFHVSPSLYPGISWALEQNWHSGWWCQLLLGPAQSHLLHQARDHRCICLLSLLHPGFSSTVGSSHREIPFLSPSQGWMKAGKSFVSNLSPIPDWEAHQCSWAGDEGNICSSFPCLGETSDTKLWILGSHNNPCSLRAYKGPTAHLGIPNFCSNYCTSH